jgi:hypothetical protein
MWRQRGFLFHPLTYKYVDSAVAVDSFEQEKWSVRFYRQDEICPIENNEEKMVFKLNSFLAQPFQIIKKCLKYLENEMQFQLRRLQASRVNPR